MQSNSEKRHVQVMRFFLDFIGPDYGLVLKGGTALLLCYDLDRFSEDLDFDATSPHISTINAVKAFCEKTGFGCYVKKETDTVQRCTVHYDDDRVLKIETSYRDTVDPSDTAIIEGISVYKLDPIAQKKADAYSSRDRLRDLHDISFIVNEQWDALCPVTKSMLRRVLLDKGLEQFDLITAQQSDDLIDTAALMANFLTAYDKATGTIKAISSMPKRASQQPTSLSASEERVRLQASADALNRDSAQQTPRRGRSL